MKDYKIAISALFDRDRDPVLLVRDGRIHYFNESAELLFRNSFPLEEDGPLPTVLVELEGEGDCTVAGINWSVWHTELAEGTLCRMTENQRDTTLLTSRRMREVASRTRDAVDAMAASVRKLEEGLVETERLRQEAPIAALEKRIHQLMCVCWDLDLLVQAEEPGEMEKLYPMSYLNLEEVCREVCMQADYLLECAGCKLTFQGDTEGRKMTVKGHEYLLNLLLCHLLADAVGGLYGAEGEIRVKMGRSRDQVFVSVDRIGEVSDRIPLAPGGVPWRGGLEDLGMPVCEEIVRHHGGAVAVTQADQFRCLVLSLPAADESEELPFHPLRSMGVDFTGGYVPVLVILSRVLPEKVFAHRELE